MSNELNHYAERDAEELDDAGGYYFRHVMAMTREKLHGKSAIAAELGYRDMIIAQQQAQIEKYRLFLDDLCTWNKPGAAKAKELLDVLPVHALAEHNAEIALAAFKDGCDFMQYNGKSITSKKLDEAAENYARQFKI